MTGQTLICKKRLSRNHRSTVSRLMFFFRTSICPVMSLSSSGVMIREICSNRLKVNICVIKFVYTISMSSFYLFHIRMYTHTPPQEESEPPGIAISLHARKFTVILPCLIIHSRFMLHLRIIFYHV